MEENLIIRKPTDDEQRFGKIVTSDYLISAVTIHSSVLKTLGWLSKVYRSKKTTIVKSNKAEINKTIKTLTFLSSNKKRTFVDLFELLEEADKHESFMNEISNKSHLKWIEINCEIPDFVIKFKFRNPNTLTRTVAKIKELKKSFEDVLEGLSHYKFDKKNTIAQLLPSIIDYLKKIETSNKKGHT